MLSEFIRWLNEQPAGTQQLVVLVTATVIALAGRVVSWSAVASRRRLHRSIARSREARQLQQTRLAPSPRLPLYDTYDIEPKAIQALMASFRSIHDLRTAFVDRMAKWPERLAIARQQSKAAERTAINDQASQLSQFSGDLTRHVRELRAATSDLSDAWSSRMYWHDLRGSAGDILGTSRSMVKDLLDTTRRTSRDFTESVDSFTACEGLTRRMDKAVIQYRNAAKELARVNQDVETMYASLMFFQRQRSGLRGVFRRLTRLGARELQRSHIDHNESA